MFQDVLTYTNFLNVSSLVVTDSVSSSCLSVMKTKSFFHLLFYLIFHFSILSVMFLHACDQLMPIIFLFQHLLVTYYKYSNKIVSI